MNVTKFIHFHLGNSKMKISLCVYCNPPFLSNCLLSCAPFATTNIDSLFLCYTFALKDLSRSFANVHFDDVDFCKFSNFLASLLLRFIGATQFSSSSSFFRFDFEMHRLLIFLLSCCATLASGCVLIRKFLPEFYKFFWFIFILVHFCQSQLPTAIQHVQVRLPSGTIFINNLVQD